MDMSEKQRCLDIMKSVPWYYMAEEAGEILGKVFIGLIENDIPAKQMWVVEGRGQCVHKGYGVRLYDVKRRKKRGEKNIGYMLQDHENDAWDAWVQNPAGGIEKIDQKEGFPGPYEASAWIAGRWDELRVK